MTSFDPSAWFENDFPRLVAEHGVPGAAVGVLVDGQVREAAAGVLSLSTGVTTTTDMTVGGLQIGAGLRFRF